MTMEKLLTQEQAAELLALAPATLEKMRQRGDGPPFLKLGRGRSSPVRYSPTALQRYVLESEQRCTTGARGTASAL